MQEIPPEYQLFAHTLIKGWTKEMKEDEAERRKPLEEGVKLLLEDYNRRQGGQGLIRKFAQWGGWLTAGITFAKFYFHL